MKIAIIADSHDHEENLKKVLEAVKDADLLIHCGDIIAPFSVIGLGRGYKNPIHIVWGNNDGDHKLCREKAAAYGQITIHGDLGELTVGGRKIVFMHYPDLAEKLVQSGKYDLVCYGHTHRVDLRSVGTSQIVNPGDVMGRFDSKAHYAIYDTETNNIALKSIDANPA